jgi:hypothetical protein
MRRKALTFGIASDVVASNNLDGAVSTLVEHLRKMPLPAVLALKEYARSAFGMSTQGATDFARNLHATVNSFFRNEKLKVRRWQQQSRPLND